MSLDHKAYFFDWRSFSTEMLPWFRDALARSDCNSFYAFVLSNRDYCRSPYEGEPLGAGWEKEVDVNDLQQLADFALTKYYDPSQNRGLSAMWIELDDTLSPELKKTLTGFAIEGFDPGLQGSYFLTPEDARSYAKMLQTTSNVLAREYGQFLECAANGSRGVYITF